MKRSRWRSREAQELMRQTNQQDPEAAMVMLAERLLDEAAFSSPPFRPEILASYQGVREVRYSPMSGAARIWPDGDALVIEVNEAHSRGKQNFSIDHEIAHTLFPTYNCCMIEDAVTGEFPDGSEEERLCDIGAATLLLDARHLRPLACAAGPSIASLIELADLFQASVEATARQLAKLDLWPCAFVFWEEGFRQVDRPRPGQILLPGTEHLGLPKAKLRVTRAYIAPSLGWFIPRNKSVPENSLFRECWERDEIVSGIERLDIGREIVETYVECLYAPYYSNSVRIGRVVSLLLPCGLRRHSPTTPVSYQVEFL